MKKFLPKSFLMRTLMLIFVPMALSMLVVGAAFFNDHWNWIQRYMARGLANEIVAINRLMDNNPDIALQVAHDLRINVTEHDVRNRAPENDNLRHEVSVFAVELTRRLPANTQPDVYVDRQDRMLDIDIERDGKVVTFNTTWRRVYSSNVEMFIYWLMGSMAFAFLLCVPFIIAHNKSVRHLARAANKFGRGLNALGFEPSGSLEIREAGRSLIEMKERLDRYNKNRTDMLNAVSHDLKAPLARMRLSAEAGTIDSEKLSDDIDRMTAMINGYLSFARGDMSEIEQEISIGPMLNRMVKDMDGTGKIKLNLPAESVSFYARPNAISRALANIISNALRYAKSAIEITERDGGNDTIEITIDDDGIGIAPEFRADALRPFTRLDAARGADAGGAGLGLAIAKTAIENHGGQMILEDSPLGGLRVRILLPI